MEPNFDAAAYITAFCARQGERLRGEIVVACVSGGCDSATAAALVHAAGAKVEPLFIDTGFLRSGEAAEVKELLSSIGLGPLRVVEKQVEFLAAVEGKSVPAEKRTAFQETYFQCLTEYLENQGVTRLVQGTQFYRGAKIYHNCPTESFLKKDFTLIEPVQGLAKHSIHLLGKGLGLPEQVLSRKPFPGPGLLIRVGGEWTGAKAALIRRLTKTVDDYVTARADAFSGCVQIFPYLADGSAVTYVGPNGPALGAVVLLRAVSRREAAGQLLHESFSPAPAVAAELTSLLMEIPGVARVCLDLTSKLGQGERLQPGGTVEYQ